MLHVQLRYGGILAHINALFQSAVTPYKCPGIGDIKWREGESLRFLSSEGICIEGDIKALSFPLYGQQDVLKVISKLLLSKAIKSKIICQKLKVMLKSSSCDRGESLYRAFKSHRANGYIVMTFHFSMGRRKKVSFL